MGEDAGQALVTGALRGASVGSIVPGVGTLVGAGVGGLLGVAMNLMPGAAHTLGSSADLAQQAVTAVQTLTGTQDPAGAQAALDDDPGLAGDLRVQLAQIANEAQAEANRAAEARQASALADVQNARAQMLALSQAGSPMAKGAAIISAVVLVAWFSSMLANYFGAPPLSADDAATLRNLSIAVVSFWIGSSYGSFRKTELQAKHGGGK